MSKELRFPNVNSVELSGRLTRDPELKHLQSGMAILNIDIAFNRNFKKGDNWEQSTSYIQIKLWGDKAEKMAQYLHKGSPIIAEGYLEQESWKNKENQTVSKMVLTAHKIHNLEKDSSENSGYQNQDEDDQI